MQRRRVGHPAGPFSIRGLAVGGEEVREPVVEHRDLEEPQPGLALVRLRRPRVQDTCPHPPKPLGSRASLWCLWPAWMVCNLQACTSEKGDQATLSVAAESSG